jgi:Fe2+ or Zn2+ uptake regulation protein
VQTPAELTDAFRRNGLKVTPQRELVFRILHGNDGHPTAEAVYAVARAAMPTISLKTVYQVLHDLADLGELQMLDVGTGAARFDPNVDGHQHLVCTTCGAVRDVSVAPELSVPADQAHGFEITSAEVIFRGRCAACRRNS